MRLLFADADYLIALLNPRDEIHARALEVSKSLESHQLYKSELVLTEVLNGLARFGPEIRRVASGYVRDIRRRSDVTVVPQGTIHFEAAVERYSSRLDKEWGLTDCASFLIMEQNGVAEALTHDLHFVQAGFQALLRDGAS